MWAIGPLNQRQEVSYHRLRTSGDMFIDFARVPKWNCPSPDESARQRPSSVSHHLQSSSATVRPAITPVQPALPPPVPISPVQPSFPVVPIASSSSSRNIAWKIPPIVCPADTTIRAQIGPTGGTKGYQSITGRVGWGIAWYMNGLLIPELTLQRGVTYTFIVEGGNDPNASARRHPLYLTDSHEGGFDFKSDEERKDERIYGGVGIRSDGVLVPTAEGRLCEWKIDPKSKERPDQFEDFFSFQRTLNLDCQQVSETRLATPKRKYDNWVTEKYAALNRIITYNFSHLVFCLMFVNREMLAFCVSGRTRIPPTCFITTATLIVIWAGKFTSLTTVISSHQHPFAWLAWPTTTPDPCKTNIKRARR